MNALWYFRPFSFVGDEHMCRRIIVVWVWALLPAGLAWGSTQDLDLQTFKPAVGAYDVFQLQSPRVSKARAWSTRVGYDYAFQPFRYVEGDGTVSPFIHDRTTLIVGAAWAATSWLELGVLIPTTPHQRFGVHARLDPHLVEVPSAGMGDVMFVPKVGLYDRGGFALGVSAPVTFPTHKDGAFLGHDEITVRPRVLAEWHGVRWLRVVGNGGAVVRRQATFLEVDHANAFEWGVAAEAPLWLGDHQLAPTVSIAGEAREWKAREEEAPAQLMAGVRWSLPSGMALSVGAGPGLTYAAGTPQWRTYAAVSFTSPDIDARRERALARLAMKMVPEPVALEPAPVKKVVVDEAAGKIVILEKVYFAVDQDVILPKSYDVLNQVAQTLRARRDIEHVLIEGHTDDTGSHAYNRDLSERRAANVRRFLIERSVAPERLTSAGFGESRPVDAKTSDEARAKNRRVEFTIVSRHTEGLRARGSAPSVQDAMEQLEAEAAALDSWKDADHELDEHEKELDEEVDLEELIDEDSNDDDFLGDL